VLFSIVSNIIVSDKSWVWLLWVLLLRELLGDVYANVRLTALQQVLAVCALGCYRCNPHVTSDRSWVWLL
jgi:hypothetical protein